MDAKGIPASSDDNESSAASWNPALRSEKATAVPAKLKPPVAPQPESSSEEESEEEDEEDDDDEEESEEEEESVPAKPVVPAPASTNKPSVVRSAENATSNPPKTAAAAPQTQPGSVETKQSSEVDALAAATQGLKINETSAARQQANSSDEEESEEDEDEESSDEEAAPGERPAENYEHQGDVSALEAAIEESAKAPLVADAALETDDWGNSDNAFDLGSQPQEAPLQTPRAEAVGTTVGDAVIGNTTVGGNTGDDLDWGNAGEEEDFFGGSASKVIENAPAAEQTPGAHLVESSEAKPAKGEWDLDLDLDDDFLEEQEAPAIELSDDEGFLDDEPVAPAQSTAIAPGGTSRYAPKTSQPAPASGTGPYAPQSQFANVPQTSQPKAAISPAYGGFGQNLSYQQQQPRPTSSSSAQSFADKAKGGYASPYDMPDDIVTTRRRPAPRTSLPAAQPTPPPPRTSSMSSTSAPPRPLPPSSMSAASLSPPSSSQSMQGQMTGLPPNGPAKTAPPAKPASSDFFAELPVTSKPKPSGRYTPSQNTPAQSPSFPPPHALPPKERTASWSSLRNEVLPDSIGAPPQLRQAEQLPMFPSQPSVPARQNSLPIPPPAQAPPSARYSPAPPAAGPGATARYSPAPPSASGPANARYSPAPNAQGSAHARYVSEPPVGPPRPPSQTYAPRTSSPLAYHSTPQQQEPTVTDAAAHQYPGHHVSQSADALPRAPFRSPLEGVSETEEQGAAPYPQAPPTTRSETPPMRSSPSSNVGSPRKKGNYTPQYQPTQGVPSRSLSQSPATSMRQSAPSYGALPTATPYSMYGSTSTSTSVNVIPHRRQASVDYECIVPDDERAADPLQRWKGYPIFTWGLGGTIVTSIPKQIPRYGGGMAAPMVKCSPGEIKIQSIKEVLPLPEEITKFPGPLKGKNKKKDVQAWLSKKTEELEARLKEPSLDHSMTIEDSARSEDRVLLLKLLHLLIENDGRLEGDVADAVAKKLFSPPGEDENAEGGSFSTGADIVGRSRSNTSNVQAEPVDPRAVENLQAMLSKGEREKAVWHAVDQRLWGHAMLLSSTLSKDIWKQVVQEFVRKEVKKVGRNNQALAVLYEVFAGNHEDCVDELVPASARAGFQMMSTDGAGATQDAKQGLDKWRETVALILHNRSEGDASALLSLGRLLAQYGRVEAAHTCFIFARAVARLGGIDDAQADLVLVGIDHKQHALEMGQDLEPILLTEVYEFALSLSAQAGPYTMPHLQNYKLMHAYQLAENGYRTDAQAYCDAIAAATASVTKKSPYYNTAFLMNLEDLGKRLSQSPKDISSSWISKPSMDRVGTSLLSKFNNFIAGDDDDSGLGKAGGNEVGPFAKIAGGSPSITPSQSNADLYGAYGGYNVPTPPAATNSRYAPSNAYAPRTSSEQQRSRYEPQGRPSMESLDGQRSVSDAYMPMTPAMGSLSPQSQLSPPRQNKTQSYSPLRSEHSMSQPALGSPYLPTPPTEDSVSEDGFGAYQPPPPSFIEPPAPSAGESFNSYAPSTSTFDTPSYQPYNPDDDDDEKKDESKPKKKSFMDDDDDDDILSRASALKSGNASSKSKSDADRKADEAFRKAAEEDAKRDKEAAAKKGGGWFGGWFKKDPNAAPGPIKAKLGEESSFFYDPDLGKWVNKKAGATDDSARPAATPPPPKGPPMGPRSASGGAMPPPSSGPGLMKPPTSAPMRSTSMPPPMAAPGSRASTPGLPSDSEGPKPPTLARPSFGAASGPPSRPGTSMSNASSIDDLLGAPQARKGAAGKKKKGGRYVDVFPQGQAPS